MSALDSWLLLSGLVNGPGFYAPGFGLSYMILTGLNRRPKAQNRSLFGSGWGACVWRSCLPFFVLTISTSSGAPVQTIDRKKIKETFSVFIQGIVTTFKCKPFRKICLATFLVFNTFNTIAMFLIFHYCALYEWWCYR